MTVDGDAALLGNQATIEYRQQRGLTRTRTTHDGQQLAAVQGETQVVHTVVAVGEAEVDVPSAELNGLHLVGSLAITLVVGIDNGGIVERLAALTLQHTTLQPYLIGAREHRHIVQQHHVATCIGEDEQSHARFDKRLQLAVGVIQLVQHDVIRLAVANVVGKVL